MAQMQRKQQTQKRYSEDFKRDLVKDLERDLISVSKASRHYGISRSAIYKWMYKYSQHLKKGYRYVIEPESLDAKVERLRQELQAAHQAIGMKQMQIDFLEKVIEISEEELGYDVKKKFVSKPYAGSGRTEKNTDGQ
jgi:transposase-like protein